MSVSNFNLYNSFCCNEVNEIFSSVSDYYCFSDTSSKLFFINSNISFSILHINNRSTTKNKEKLKELLMPFHVHLVTAVALSETNLSSNNSNNQN